MYRILLLVLLVLSAVSAFGYGYFDSFTVGGRVESMNSFSAALAGATVPDYTSALSIFTNPSALTSSDKLKVSFSGWGTGWREEIKYDHRSEQPTRSNQEAFPPRASIAAILPLSTSFSLGAGFGYVAQYNNANLQVKEFEDNGAGQLRLLKTMFLTSSGDLMEGLASLSGSINSVNIGVSSGIRFGSGESTIYVNREAGSDSVYEDSWESQEFVLRAGANTCISYTNVYTSYVSGSDRYLSYSGLGVVSEFPFLKGGFLGAEIALFDEELLKVMAFTKLPGAMENSSIYMGVSGYRSENALKSGLGLSFGVEYEFTDYRVLGSYQYQSRYRDTAASEIPFINHIYDSGQTVMIGIDKQF